MTGFPLGQIAIIEIEITYQCAVIKSGSVNISGPTTNQGTAAAATQFADVTTYHAYGFSMQCSKTAPQRVQDPDLELLAGIGT
jgi:hypothetical protein